jgi:hypothetical protein
MASKMPHKDNEEIENKATPAHRPLNEKEKKGG